MNIKENTSICTDDFMYDLFYGGYIKPEDILVDQNDINKVRSAIDIILEYNNSCKNHIVEI